LQVDRGSPDSNIENATKACPKSVLPPIGCQDSLSPLPEYFRCCSFSYINTLSIIAW
jgi:hypothetical protein